MGQGWGYIQQSGAEFGLYLAGWGRGGEVLQYDPSEVILKEMFLPNF